jgi:hypothetical protein
MDQITKIRTALTTIALTTAVIGAVGLTALRDAHASLFDEIAKNIYLDLPFSCMTSPCATMDGNVAGSVFFAIVTRPWARRWW